ncbi:hypothetical protein F0T03_17950 [Yersinia canariae]|uniref:Uncharacterized protein n=1 Tax=Yersinia canariae TaxID=2607663 RepID=A0A857F2C1_9GAMM|nr:hypothetical protein [Yersinia canariae]QHB33856.1 hypothetical protein F0T03_17950 [Yersinia canariae]
MLNISKDTALFVVIVFFVFSKISLASVTSDITLGKYVYTQQGEELIDGKKSSITWTFSLNGEETSTLNISSWHAPFNCYGKYKITKASDELKLAWLESENKGIECDAPPPQFVIKRTSNNLFLIKSELFPWGGSEWKDLKRIN